jgi:enamine deaminase RidA (YjgF/YER057c/UK114 family)
MGAIEDRISQLGHALPGQSSPGGNYVPAVSVPGLGLVYTAGHVARRPDGTLIVGKLGADMSIEVGHEAARITALNLLGTLKEEIGELDRVTRIVKLLCMVNSTPDFGQHPAVANGASDLLVEIFGDAGKHARSAVGLASLPGGVCIEIEMIVQVSP